MADPRLATAVKSVASGRAEAPNVMRFGRTGISVGRFYLAGMEASMRIPALAILTILTALTAVPARAQTYNPDYPVCLQVYAPWPYIECAYTSLEQCRWSASGRAAMCVINPYPSPAAARMLEGNSKRQRRVY